MFDLTSLQDVSLVNPAWMVVFGLVGICFLVWAIVRKRRSGRGVLWRAILGAIALIVAVVFLVNMMTGYYPRVFNLIKNQPAANANFGETPDDPSQGTLQVAEIPGTASHVGSYPANVWLPPQYFTDKSAQFPIVYLMHGQPGSYSDWFASPWANQVVLSQSRAKTPFIMVVPTELPTPDSDTECVNGAAGNWETYLSTDVTNWARQNLRIKPGVQHSAIGGLSMGGYCAQQLALRNPSTFSAFGNFVGSTQPTFDGGMAALFGDPPNLAQTVASYSSRWIVQNQPASRSVANWLQAGADDPVTAADQAAYVSTARQLNIPVTASTVPAGHIVSNYRLALQEWLAWVLPRIK